MAWLIARITAAESGSAYEMPMIAFLRDARLVALDHAKINAPIIVKPRLIQ